MKRSILFTFISFLLFSVSGYSQYNDDDASLGLPGDNLNLYATLKIFQESETLELFEKKLNDKESNINNLDLNGDNQIDYIRVIDNVDNNVHVITLQVSISRNENQDVAVIIVQNNNNKINIQLIGDEALYGKNYIIEPNMLDEDGRPNGRTPNPGYTGSRTTVVINNYTTTEIYSWPVIRYMYAPSYRPWYSPWYWDYYPTYWRPWNPYYWHYYWGYHYHWHHYYKAHYRHWHQPRYSRINEYYGPRRTSSVTVRTKIERRDYKSTYSRPDMAEKGSETFRKKFPDNPSSREKLPSLKASEKRDNSFRIDRKADDNQRSNERLNNNENQFNSRQNNNYKNIPENQYNSDKRNQNYTVPEKQYNSRQQNNQQPDTKFKNRDNKRQEPKVQPDNNRRSEPKQSQPATPAKRESRNETQQNDRRR